MKKILLTGIGVFALTLFSCSEDWGTDSSDRAGYIVPIVEVDTKTISTRSIETRADLTADDLTLYLKKSDGSAVWSGNCKDFPADRQFAIGDYILEAKYGDVNDEGFDKIALYGAQTLTVKDGDTTEINLTASLANGLVKIVYTEAFENYMADWNAQVNNVVYEKGETRSVYVKPGDVRILLNITKPNGLNAQFSLDPIKAEARHQYIVTVDVNNGDVSDAELKITYESTLEDKEIEIDISDEVLNSPAPVIDIDGFKSGESIKIIAGLSESQTISTSIIARAGIKEVNLKTTSESLKAQKWPENINLMEADQSQQTLLSSLGLSVLGLWKTPGEMAYIEFSNVAEHIQVMPTGNNTTTFEISVVDQLSRVTEEPVILEFEVEPITMKLSNSGEYYSPGNPLTVNFEFNGELAHLQKGNVVFQFFEPDAGKWREISDYSVSEENNFFQITFNIPAHLQEEVQLKAICAGSESEVLTVDMMPIEVIVEDKNVFANYAYVQLQPIEGISMEKVNPKFYIKSNNGEFVKAVSERIDGNYIKISDLNPGTSYEIKASGVPQTFKTEMEISLENGDMEPEGWNKIPNNKAYSINGWATLNELTTSKPGGTKYSALNSTLPTNADTEDKDQTDIPLSGSSSALIRSVGYNVKGNTILAGNDANNYAVGELYLGSYSNDKANYGIDFESRPSSLTFSYKYLPISAKNNDKDQGYVEIIVLDADGKKISSERAILDEANSKTEKTIYLEYPYNSNKAKTLCVTFKSSSDNTDKFLKDAITKKTVALVLSDYYVGSKLYIDDVRLNY